MIVQSVGYNNHILGPGSVLKSQYYCLMNILCIPSMSCHGNHSPVVHRWNFRSFLTFVNVVTVVLQIKLALRIVIIQVIRVVARAKYYLKLIWKTILVCLKFDTSSDLIYLSDKRILKSSNRNIWSHDLISMNISIMILEMGFFFDVYFF